MECKLRGTPLLVGVKLAQFGKVAWLYVLNLKYLEDEFEIHRQERYIYIYISQHIHTYSPCEYDIQVKNLTEPHASLYQVLDKNS